MLRAKHTVAQMTQLTFTHKTWDTVFAELAKIDKDAKLIGWYHSHPNFGVFLSDHDKFIQSQFFGNDGQVTIVVDPIRGRSGWFVSNDKQIEVLQEERDTKTEKLGSSDVVENIQTQAAMASSNELTWGKVVGISSIFSLVSMVGGFVLSGAGDSSNSQIASLERTVSVLAAQVQDLTARLDLVNPNATVPTPKPKAPEKGSKATQKTSPKPEKTMSSGTQKTKPSTKASASSSAGSTGTTNNSISTNKSTSKQSSKPTTSTGATDQVKPSVAPQQSGGTDSAVKSENPSPASSVLPSP